ncbi:thiamine pyrophosphate-dependent dehydrogenase E1 component subunit alpha [Paenibacillus motobuensis]|uniref:Thiamine pyrophosphate-dependent dehydrogenase E1 component subunit alpha n=1 Tax=Paenibacillus motobuensis TaxID=295324 RepID=A0ABN0YAH4_9BACL
MHETVAEEKRLTAGVSDGDLETLLLIRHYELTVLELFACGEIKGTTHTCIGQEYIPVALNPFIRADDFVVSNHRGHGHYLARYRDEGDVEGLLAEVMGKSEAVCQGVGGSQHIYRDQFLSTGIQGEGIAVGAGIAWSHKFRNRSDIVFVYIGEGTFGRGCVYESLNFAGIWHLPMVIVVENNGIALSTSPHDSMSGTIEGRVRGFGLDYLRVESRHIPAIRELVGEPVKRVRTESRPLVIEFITDRVASHSKGDDTRDSAELERVKRQDWHSRMTAEDCERFERLEQRAVQRMRAIRELVASRKEAVWDEHEERAVE